MNTHIIYAGPYNLDWIDWEPDVLQKIVEVDLESSTMTFLYMYRDLLITKEKMKQICTGKGYRQKDHETLTGGVTYKDSVADDMEAFFEDVRLGRTPLPMAWTYFVPELTLHEMELVENKDQEYFRTFKWLYNADVNETEMNSSSASSKYVSGYCRRKTIAIERQKLNWFYNNENQGFDYSCFKRLIGSGWTGDIGRLRNALNAIGLLRTDSDIESFFIPVMFRNVC